MVRDRGPDSARRLTAIRPTSVTAQSIANPAARRDETARQRGIAGRRGRFTGAGLDDRIAGGCDASAVE